MATTAQILANRQNAERSHGPVTFEGKTRVSENATQAHRQSLGLPLCATRKEPGLFSVANFVRPEERDIFSEFETGYLAELSPATSLEQTLAREIIHAAWRLRRCADLEIAPPEDLTDEELDRLQASIDRARSAAQRTFHRSLKELRRLQGERLYATFVASPTKQAVEAAPDNSAKQTQSASGCLAPPAVRHSSTSGFLDSWLLPSAKQSQSEPAPSQRPARVIPRSAPCPCKSGLKYKRCCGKSAPPVLTRRAA
jgi:uncharacterized protein YecA (UPF0149 family)